MGLPVDPMPGDSAGNVQKMVDPYEPGRRIRELDEMVAAMDPPDDEGNQLHARVARLEEHLAEALDQLEMFGMHKPAARRALREQSDGNKPCPRCGQLLNAKGEDIFGEHECAERGHRSVTDPNTEATPRQCGLCGCIVGETDLACGQCGKALPGIGRPAEPWTGPNPFGNTEATPSEVEAAAEAHENNDVEGYVPWAMYYESEKAECREDMRVALNAAYAIRLPPLYAELERLTARKDEWHKRFDVLAEENQALRTRISLAAGRIERGEPGAALTGLQAALVASEPELERLREELRQERLRNPMNARAIEEPGFILPWNDAARLRREGQMPSEKVDIPACEWPCNHDDYTDWLNDLMVNAGDEWDGDEAMESLVTKYVHGIEAQLERYREALERAAEYGCHEAERRRGEWTTCRERDSTDWCSCCIARQALQEQNDE